MRKIKKLVTIGLATAMVLGMTLTASAATPRNTWCHGGAADVKVGSGTHFCGGSTHSYTIWQCRACDNLKMACQNNPL